MPESKLSSSLEDYLEAIFLLSWKDGEARVAEIAESLGFSKPSVSEALAHLESKGLIEHEKYRSVRLTPEGRDFAQQVYERHKTLFLFLTRMLGVPSTQAALEACCIEHAISSDTHDRLRQFVVSQMSQMGDGLARLSELSPGESAEIVRIEAPGWFRHRLLDMGFIAGEVVTLEKVAPLRDPIEFVIKGYHVSLRREEAAHVFIRPIKKDETIP
jgi:DtxR family Mn-dependent transcriptional regulator